MILKIVKAMVVFTVAVLDLPAIGAQLRNPYADPLLENHKIAPPSRESECDQAQGRTSVTKNPAGVVIKTDYQRLCYRLMTTPHDKHFKTAVTDAARAIRKNQMDKFDNILHAWPANKRKELHDKALEKARIMGSTINSNFPDYAYPDPNSPLESIEAVRRQPHHQDVLPAAVLNVEVEPTPSLRM